MATILRQSTAVEVKVGPFVDNTDGFTAEVALTISQADVRLAKNGADWAQKNETTAAVHEENGWYRCLLDATDTNAVGILILAISESGALPVWREFQVVEEAVFDAMFATSANLASAVWDEDAGAHVNIGTFGQYVDTLYNNPPPLSAASTGTAVWDLANGIETGITPRGALRLNTAALAGKVSGAGTSTETFRNVGDSKNRIVSTVDSSGNRTAVTTDVT